MNLKWFPLIGKFRKEIRQRIKDIEKDSVDPYEIRLHKTVKNIQEIVPQIRKWSKLLSDIENFYNKLEIEFEAWESELYILTKKDLILEQDERKKKKLKVYEVKSVDIKRAMCATEEHMQKKKAMSTIKHLINSIEKVDYWPSNKQLEALKMLHKFSIAYEKDYGKIPKNT